MKERDIINEALIYSSKDIQNAFEAGVKSIKDKLPSLEGIMVVEKCEHRIEKIGELCNPLTGKCPLCNETGTITRQAEWGDIDIKKLINAANRLLDYKFPREEPYDFLDLLKNALTTKSGGRLRVHEKD